MTQAETTTAWPGRELRDDYLRTVAQRLVREQGWRYEIRSKHGRLYAPDGARISVPKTPSDWRSRLNSVAEMKRHGADLEEPPIRRRVRTVRPFSDAPDMGDVIEKPWTESEWRAIQADADEWWRRQYAKPSVTDETSSPAEVKPQVSAYQAGVIARLEAGSGPRPDARGENWSLADARRMLRDGYSLAHVTRLTGWGSMWLDDLVTRLAQEQGG